MPPIPELVAHKIARELDIDVHDIGVSLACLSFVSFAIDAGDPREIRLLALALDRAMASDLSVYDACYVVLADALGATLVTADHTLAAAAGRAELIG